MKKIKNKAILITLTLVITLILFLTSLSRNMIKINREDQVSSQITGCRNFDNVINIFGNYIEIGKINISESSTISDRITLRLDKIKPLIRFNSLKSSISELNNEKFNNLNSEFVSTFDSKISNLGLIKDKSYFIYNGNINQYKDGEDYYTVLIPTNKETDFKFYNLEIICGRIDDGYLKNYQIISNLYTENDVINIMEISYQTISLDARNISSMSGHQEIIKIDSKTPLRVFSGQELPLCSKLRKLNIEGISCKED